MRKGCMAGLCLMVLVMLAWPASAAITADFDGAAGDGYPGSAGNGWGGGWMTKASANSVSWASGVGSSYGSMSPGGGSYLGNVYQFKGGSGYHLLSRQYESNALAGVDLAEPHRITFKFRLNSTTTNWDDSLGRDSISFYDDVAGDSYFSSSPTWIFGTSSRTGDTTPKMNFEVIDGNRAGTGTSIDSGIALAQGTVYTFIVTTHPGTRSWDAVISDGSTTFSQAGLGWRSSVADVGGFINMRGSVSYSPKDRLFSIDSVSIIAVPEPGGAFLLLAAALALRRRPRRTRKEKSSPVHTQRAAAPAPNWGDEAASKTDVGVVLKGHDDLRQPELRDRPNPL